jgi:hypothetical protein
LKNWKMKSKILILFLLIWNLTFSQVPNTTTFTLQDVENAIPGTQGNLQQCFTDAIPGYFDATYSGSKNSLLNFRNYGACPAYVSSGSFTTLSSANSLSVTYPAVSAGDFVFIAAGHYSSSAMSISGWSILSSASHSSFRYTIFYKHFSSSDAGGSVSVTSSDYVNKFATAHKIKANTTNTLTLKNSLLALPTDTYTPGESVSGTSCEMILSFASLFISQSLGISAGTGWTVRNNAWLSSFGANSLTTYNFTSSTTAPSNTYNFTGEVPFGYVSVLIE